MYRLPALILQRLKPSTTGEKLLEDICKVIITILALSQCQPHVASKEASLGEWQCRRSTKFALNLWKGWLRMRGSHWPSLSADACKTSRRT